jgi:hypothetical protein
MVSVYEDQMKTHVITFRFGKLSSWYISLIKQVEITCEKTDSYDQEKPLNASVLIGKDKGLHLIVENLLYNASFLENTYCISFCDLSGKEVFRDVFGLEINEDDTLYMYSIKSRASVNTVSASFYQYLLDLFRRYESFSDVPNSSILITRNFLDYKKCLLKYYFNDKRVGFKETLESLNKCLSQINKKEDISDQLNNFINDRRTNLLRKNDCFAGFESLRSKCSNVEFELTSLLIDTLTLLKSYTEEKIESISYSSLDNQSIYVVIKEVKVFEMPDTIRRKKGSKLQLEIDLS